MINRSTRWRVPFKYPLKIQQNHIVMESRRVEEEGLQKPRLTEFLHVPKVVCSVCLMTIDLRCSKSS